MPNTGYVTVCGVVSLSLSLSLSPCIYVFLTRTNPSHHPTPSLPRPTASQGNIRSCMSFNLDVVPPVRRHQLSVIAGHFQWGVWDTRGRPQTASDSDSSLAPVSELSRPHAPARPSAGAHTHEREHEHEREHDRKLVWGRHQYRCWRFPWSMLPRALA